jgi:hypothetical protein
MGQYGAPELLLQSEFMVGFYLLKFNLKGFPGGIVGPLANYLFFGSQRMEDMKELLKGIEE